MTPSLMKVFNLRNKIFSRGSDPGNQPSKIYISIRYKLKSKYQAGTKNFCVLTTYSFSFSVFPSKMNFWLRETRNHGITVKYYSSTYGASLQYIVRNVCRPQRGFSNNKKG